MRTAIDLVALLAAVAAASAVSGCSRSPSALDIATIGVTQEKCDPDCRFLEITLHRSGVATIGDNIGNSFDVTLPDGEFSRIARDLVRTPFFTGPSDYRSDRRGDVPASIFADTKADVRFVRLPRPQGDFDGDGSLARLERFIDTVRIETAPLLFRAESDVRSRLDDVAHLTEVSYHTDGCYGRCPISTVTFFSDGRALLYTRLPAERFATRANALVPFARIVELLRASNFTFLERRDRVLTQDAFGSQLRLDYRGGFTNGGFTYWSEGHDSTTWSPVYRNVAERIEQLVSDTTWNSPKTGSRFRSLPR